MKNLSNLTVKLKQRAGDLKRDIPALFLALKRKDTPLSAKILAGLSVAYALSPIDLIPDFIPVLGYLDDLIILPILVALTVKRIPRHILMEVRIQAEGMWQDGKPKRWYYSLPIITFWLIVAAILVKTLIT